jgi:Domain of unknown function (DUF4868)
VTEEPAQIEDRRAALQIAVGHDEAVAHLVLAWRRSPPFYQPQLVALDTATSGRFLDLARTAATRLAGEKTRVAYDPEWPLGDHEFFELVGDERPAPEFFADLADFLNLPRFHRKNLTKPRLYVVAVQSPDGLVLFGRKMAQLKVLKRSPGLFTAVWDGSTFNELEHSVATFSTTFDWVYWEDRLYVIDAGRFHGEFRDFDAVKAAVDEHITTITNSISIEGSDEFAKRCRASVPMASKLKRVAENGIWTEDVAKLKDYAKRWNIHVDWKGDALVFDGSIERQWGILKLLDEDGTTGPVTGRKYESAAKRRVS